MSSKKRKGFKPTLAALYRKHVGDDSTDTQVERNRERVALKRSITAVAHCINRCDKEHTRQYNRMMEENVTLTTESS